VAGGDRNRQLFREREEIVEFAHRYDPQPFHVDENAAKASIFGGLIASGWPTRRRCSCGFFVDRVLAGGAPSARPESTRFVAEARAARRHADGASHRLEAAPSRSKPDRATCASDTKSRIRRARR
jgi:hypothetical protein